MNYLFALTIHKTYVSSFRRTFYVISSSREKAIDMVNNSLKQGYVLKNVKKLGHEISGVMFSNSKDKV